MAVPDGDVFETYGTLSVLISPSETETTSAPAGDASHERLEQFDHALELVIQLIPCTYASVHLLEPRTGVLTRRAARPAAADPALLENEKLRAVSVLSRLGTAADPGGTYATDAWQGVPIVSRRSVVGLLLLHVPASPALNETQRAAAHHVAWHIAASIEASEAQRHLQLAHAAERAARERAEGDSRRKDDFLATLSHELRQPLSAALPALEIQKRSLNPERRQRAGEVVEAQLHLLARMVENLTDLSHISRGVVVLQRAPTDLCLLVRDVVDVTAGRFASKRQVIQLTCAFEPAWVFVDPTRMTQVLSNLLQNAASYTGPSGHIGVTVTREGDQVVCRISDDGIGIASNMLRRIWEPFQRGRADPSERSFGVGLAVVRQIVELHGGSVAATSDGVNSGSQFIFRLPIDATALRAAGVAG